jgi:hypothetical protein
MNEQTPIVVEANPESVQAPTPIETALTKCDTARSILTTASQAKIEAIADLTHSAYQKAATLKLNKEESDELQADFPDEAFRTGAAGKDNLIYIEHAFLRDRFTQVFGMGQWAIISRRSWSEQFTTQGYPGKPPTQGERVYVEAMLVVRGCFVGEAIGAMEYYPKNAAQNYGDAVEGAKTAAFRRCAKEFGVGLQAWKKDWCQGWMDRKMGKVPRGTSAPVQHSPIKPKPEPKLPTAETRKWMIKETKADGENRKVVEEYFVKVAQLLPTEQIEDLPLRFVPFSKQELDALINCLSNFEAGGDAVRAFDPHGEADAPAKNVPRRTSDVAGIADEEMWYGAIVPIPRKGMKRDEYLKNPDTIGSLYDARKDDEDARKRLWGLRKGGEECGWVPKPREYNGKTYQPSEADKKFYLAMKDFAAWYDENHQE